MARHAITIVDMQVLTPEELDKLQHIQESARREGWLTPGAQLRVERTDSSVRVCAIVASNVVEKSYPSDERWLFQLVRDLAWGAYLAGGPYRGAGCRSGE